MSLEPSFNYRNFVVWCRSYTYILLAGKIQNNYFIGPDGINELFSYRSPCTYVVKYKKSIIAFSKKICNTIYNVLITNTRVLIVQ